MWGHGPERGFGSRSQIPPAVLAALQGLHALPSALQTGKGPMGGGPASPPFALDGATSPSGHAFARRAERAMSAPGAFGTRPLADAWAKVTDPAEKAALLTSIDTQLDSQVAGLSEQAVAAAAGGSPGGLLRIQRQLRAVRELEAATGAEQHRLTPAAVDAIRSRLANRVERLEREGDSVAMQGLAASPDAMASLAQRIGGLGGLLDLVEDPRLKARLEAIMPQVAAAADSLNQVDQISQLGELGADGDSAEQTD